jgi:hypothetical protein
MKSKAIEEVSKDTLAIEAFFSTVDPDALATYAEIQRHSGVTMDLSGKAKLRVAAKRAGLNYSTIKGVGIRFAGPRTGCELVLSREQRVTRAARRAEKVADAVYKEYGVEMDAHDREIVAVTAAAFATIRVLAEEKRREIRAAARNRPPVLPAVGPDLRPIE